MEKEDIPSLKESIKNNWQGLLLPVLIILPFILDFLLKDNFFTARLGASGASYFSKSLLIIIPGIVSVIRVLLAKDKKKFTPSKLADIFAASVKSISPVVATCLFGYMIGALFADLNVAADLGTFMASVGLGKFGTIIFITLLTCFLGMVVPGSSLVVIFGEVIIATFAGVGIDPILAAAMLPCICGVMCGITPPLALGMYAGMSIAESDFGRTVKNDLWWVALQFILQAVILMGWLPILGL
jgi:TRAP-type C4-dicarboxylate transport system permease large subunit